MTGDAEEWRPVPGYEGHYEVSNMGRVKALERWTRNGSRLLPETILKQADNGTGHKTVAFHKDGVQRKQFVHRLVLLTFAGQGPPGTECCHWDDDPANNRLENLRWASRAENCRDKSRNGKDKNRAKTHCPRGHEYSEANTYVYKNRRNCRACRRCDYGRKVESN